MPKRKWMLAAVVVLAVMSGAPAGAADRARVNALAKRVPAQSMLFIAVDGDNAALGRTALAAILREPEVKELLDGPAAAVRRFLADQLKANTGLDLQTLTTALRSKVGLALVNVVVPPGGGQPVAELLLMVEVGRPDSARAKAVDALLRHAMAKTGLPPELFQPVNIAGVRARTAQIGPVQVGYATHAGVFVLGTGGALQKALAAGTPKLAQDASFLRASAHTGGDEILLVHYNHKAVLKTFGGMMPPGARAVLADEGFGLANLRSVTLSVAADGPGLRTSLFVHTPGGPKGVVKLIGGKVLGPALARLAPRDAGFLYARSFDPAAAWDFFVALIMKKPGGRQDYDREMADFVRQLGFDLRNDFLASLGDEFAVFGPDLTLAVKLRNPAGFKRCLEKILAKLMTALAKEGGPLRGARVKLRTMQYRNHTITYLDTVRVPLPIQPCYAMVGPYAVFSLSPMSLKSYLIKLDGGQRLVDAPEFRAVRAKLAAGASSIYYADAGLFIEQLYGLAPMVLGILKVAPDQAAAMLPDPARLPPPGVVSRHLFACVSGWRSERDGILWQCYSPVALPVPPVIRGGSLFGGPAALGILAGMSFPALGKAREEAQRAKSMSNLKQIAQASMVWLIKFGDNSKYPPSLKKLMDNKIIEEPRIFLHPNGSEPVKGKFVSDYDSIFDRAGFQLQERQVPPETTPLAWEKKAFAAGGRCVVFFDAHVECVPEERFRELMKTVDALIGKCRPKKK